jgi:hypothetical protein
VDPLVLGLHPTVLFVDEGGEAIEWWIADELPFSPIVS